MITGTPVQLLEYTTLLKESYEEAARYALGAIALLVFLHFRSVICVLLALTPVGLGTWWMLGVMGERGIDFNPANIMEDLMRSIKSKEALEKSFPMLKGEGTK